MITKWKPVIFLLPFLFVLFCVNCKITANVSAAEVEQEVFRLVNEYRQSIQKENLTWREEIAQECRTHSENMASGVVPLSHDGYEQRYANIKLTIDAIGFAENVACVAGHSDPAQYTVDLWLGKVQHTANIEGDYNLTGVGVAKDGANFYITQIFIKSK